MRESRVPVESFPPEKNIKVYVLYQKRDTIIILYYRRFNTSCYVFVYLLSSVFEHIVRSYVYKYGRCTMMRPAFRWITARVWSICNVVGAYECVTELEIFTFYVQNFNRKGRLYHYDVCLHVYVSYTVAFSAIILFDSAYEYTLLFSTLFYSWEPFANNNIRDTCRKNTPLYCIYVYHIMPMYKYIYCHIGAQKVPILYIYTHQFIMCYPVKTTCHQRLVRLVKILRLSNIFYLFTMLYLYSIILYRHYCTHIYIYMYKNTTIYKSSLLNVSLWSIDQICSITV